MVRLLLLMSLFTSIASAKPETLFEGYAKVISNEKHIGFVISRYQYDNAKKQFYSSYLLKTNINGIDITESLKAVATSDFAPVSYEYTTVTGKETKTIDAKFKGDQMVATIKEGKKTERIDKKIPKGTFLSTFLLYLMMKSPDGLKAESKYEYSAIAEEDASIQAGKALVGKEQDYLGQRAYRILNTFKGIEFLSYVSLKGEVLGTDALGQNIKTELTKADAATAGFAVSPSVLKLIFGDIPKGEKNSLVSPLQNGKSEGIPPGKGIQVKGK